MPMPPFAHFFFFFGVLLTSVCIHSMLMLMLMLMLNLMLSFISLSLPFIPSPLLHFCAPPTGSITISLSHKLTRHAQQPTHASSALTPSPTTHVHLQRHLARLRNRALLAGPLL